MDGELPPGIWPESLRIRDTGLDDGYKHIWTTAGMGYPTVEYVRADLARQPAPSQPADAVRELVEAAKARSGGEVLDRGFKYENGAHTPTVLVGFAPNDWKARPAGRMGAAAEEVLRKRRAASVLRLRSNA